MDEPRGTVRAARGKSASSVRREIGRSASAPSTGRDRAGPARFNRADAFANSFYGDGPGGGRHKRSDRRGSKIVGGARYAAVECASTRKGIALAAGGKNLERGIARNVLGRGKKDDRAWRGRAGNLQRGAGCLEFTKYEIAAAGNEPAATVCARANLTRR